MNEQFRTFVESGRTMAATEGLLWDVSVADDGSVLAEDAWNLTEVSGGVPPPTVWLSDLGSDSATLRILNLQRILDDVPLALPFALPGHWQDLIKTVILRQLCVEQNTAKHVTTQVARPLRVLATCVYLASGNEPWRLTIDDIRSAVKVAGTVQASGALATHVASVVRGVLDVHRLCDNGPFNKLVPRKKPRASISAEPLRRSLADRRSEEKLPSLAEFWLLVEIVFTRKPLTFVDRLRFAILRVQILCGFRISEACSIPVDWERTQEHVDVAGRPAGEIGGVSTTMRIRHFAAKQQGYDQDSVLLTETLQHVPEQFESILRSTLDEVKVFTEPLRRRLKAQAESRRAFPEFRLMTLVPISDLYTRLTGNPFVKTTDVSDETGAYLATFGEREMAAIVDAQDGTSAFRMAFCGFWKRWEDGGGPPLRDAEGNLRPSGRREASKLYVLVADLERHVAANLATKLSDIDPLPLLGGGVLPSYELMFLMPKRALSEGRNEGVCDIGRYFSVGRIIGADIIHALGNHRHSLFARYGETEEERSFSMPSHAIRHLQNGELFRLCISDAAITKRFDRKSVAQSHVYDHRSLAEELEAMSLPREAEALPERARIVAKLIKLGRGRGPIVDEFRRILAEDGAEIAYQFLAAEADGFHVTPYGFCVNGFTQEPCPKHLQCFNGCGHLLSTGNAVHTDNLRTLERRTQQAVDIIEGRKGGLGRANQLAHAKTVLTNVRRIIDTPAGEAAFPGGPDLSRPVQPRTILDA